MVIRVKSGEFSAVAKAAAKRRVDTIVKKVVKEIAYQFILTFSELKHTWSTEQTGTNWSGQYQFSLRVSEGSIDRTFADDNPGHWPEHDHPYKTITPDDFSDTLNNIAPYTKVYLSDSAPHAADVEKHTKTFARAKSITIRAAAGFVKSSFSSTWSVNAT